MKEFHISDVLSITTGALLSSRHIEGVYDILNHMTADSLFTHQLPRASEQCKPYLLKQFPELADIEVPTDFNGERERVEVWVMDMAEIYGEDFNVMTIAEHGGSYQPKEPITELAEMLDERK